jgi:hypothetical protein
MSCVRPLQVICRTLNNRGKCRPEGQTSSTDVCAGSFHAGNLIEKSDVVKEYPGRDALGLELDPTATLGGDKAWHRSHSSSGSVGSTKWRRSPAWSHFIAFVPECPTAFPPPPWRWQKTTIRPRYRAGIRDYAVTDRTRPETSIAG